MLEGRNKLSLRSREATRRVKPEDFALSLKAIVRSGSLQGDSGVSIAVEPSVLLPGVLSDEGIGTQIGVILSRRWSSGPYTSTLCPESAVRTR